MIELTSARESVVWKVFRMLSTVRLQAVANRVCGELIMMTQLHHPNIVKCKGVSLLMDQLLPVLVMEWLMNSLHAYLLHHQQLESSSECLHGKLFNGLGMIRELTKSTILALGSGSSI